MKTTGLAGRIFVPPIAGFVLVAAYVAAEAMGLHALARPEAGTVSEAAALGQAARALQLIDAGQSADGPMPVREGILDRERHELTPVQAAILGRHAELVRLLQRSGATHWEDATTSCFARMRLPAVLSDLGAPAAAPAAEDADVETTIRSCSAQGTRL